MVIHKDAELKARIKILKYLNFLLCVKQQPFFSGKRLIPVEMKKNREIATIYGISWNSQAIF